MSAPNRDGGKQRGSKLGTSLKATRGAVEQGKKITAADEARAEALLALIERRKARIAEDFYDLGEALRELQQKKLYLALGHRSFADMLNARGIMSLSQAKKLIEVAASMPRDKALAVGAEKAYALARYAAATPEPDTPAWLVETNAKIGAKHVRDISLREIEDATKKVRSARGEKKASPEERAAHASAKEVRAWLRRRGVKDATVTAKRTKGSFWLTIALRADAASVLLGE